MRIIIVKVLMVIMQERRKERNINRMRITNGKTRGRMRKKRNNMRRRRRRSKRRSSEGEGK